MIRQQDALEFMRTQADYSADLIYCDPPYALGSEIVICSDGKVDYKKVSDFMNKWDMPDGKFWEDYFKEAFRTLKYGGHLVMFGLDRQLLLFKYYSALAGFTEKQSLYWFFISNFPKASDLSKNIDKNAGAEREITGTRKAHDIRANALMEATDENLKKEVSTMDYNYTKPSTPLAKKYSGYKYSIAPLKQTNETIMIFQRPYKTKSCLHDTLEYENGNEKCLCGALDIEKNRVPLDKNDPNLRLNAKNHKGHGHSFGDESGNNLRSKNDLPNMGFHNSDGRYPAQTYCNSQAGKKLGEANKVLHKCDFEKEEHDLYFYCPKVSKSERNAGCEELKDSTLKWLLFLYSDRMREDKGEATGLNKEGRFAPIQVKNNHPTVKPISLNHKILSLFKTPNKQRLLVPFAGSGSEIIGAIKAGYTDIEGCEINREYIEIAEARIAHWSKKFQEDNRQSQLV